MTRRVGAFSRVPALACLFLLTFGADDTTTEAELPKRSARIVDYSIDARLVPETQSVEGRQTLTWRNTSSAAVDRLWFHLYLNAFKDEKSTFMRESSGSHRRQHADKEHPGSIEIGSMKISGSEQELWTDDTRSWEAPDDGNEHDRTVAAVQLPKAVGPGDSITLEIAFTSKLPRVFARTGWAGDPGAPETLFFMVAQWFPKIGVLEELEPGKPAFNCHQFHRSTEFYADYGTYEVRIDVPKDFVVGATGRRVSAEPGADGRMVYTHVQEDVHDFAWCAAPDFVEKNYTFDFDTFCKEAPGSMGQRLRNTLAEAADHRGVDAASIKPTPVKIRFLLQPDHADPEVWERYKWSTGAAIACYGIWFGHYPYDVLTVVDPPDGGRGAGGMEYPTLFTGGQRRLAPSYFMSPEGVTIHEFGHQFFYGLLGNNEFEEAWLDEGINSFGDARTSQAAYGPGTQSTNYGAYTPRHRPFEMPSVFGRLSSAVRLESWTGRIPKPEAWKKEPLFAQPRANHVWNYLRDMPFLHLDQRVMSPQPYEERSRVLGVASEDSMLRPGWEYAERDDYWVNSYSKPTVFLYALRGLMGPKTFDRMMYAYAEKQRFQHPTTKDFLAMVDRFAPEVAGAQEHPELSDLVRDFSRVMLESGAKLDVAVLSVQNRKLEGGEGGFEWTVRVQRRGRIPVPLEVIAVDHTGEEQRWTWLATPGETTRTFRVVRPRKLKSARVGPDWIGILDRDITNNARLVDEHKDIRPAVVLTARWTLYVDELLRTYVGVDR